MSHQYKTLPTRFSKEPKNFKLSTIFNKGGHVNTPLDDTNVVRLIEMLKSMSETIQFLFVSHNKITMEIAEQLIGVTMQEPGVSRLVSVNMEEAVHMAANG